MTPVFQLHLAERLERRISGPTPATILWVRIATVGPGGQLRAWSAPAKIVVQ